MKLQINGESKIIESEKSPLTIKFLLNELGHHPRLVVIELNGLILPPKKWDEQELNDGDTIEIVTIVGGGS